VALLVAYVPLKPALVVELRVLLGVCRSISAPELSLGRPEHATRLALWGEDPRAAFARAVAGAGVPLHLVGLPQSTVYMRDTRHAAHCTRAPPLGRPLAVNNIQNVFTTAGGAVRSRSSCWLRRCSSSPRLRMRIYRPIL
jgi:hypothetical protein